MSSRTRFLSKLIGLYSIALSLALLAHPRATVEIMQSTIQDRPLLFIAGLLGLTAGLAIILVHNVWSGGVLPVVVTIFGWAALVKGMLLLLLSPATEARVFMVGSGYQQHPIVYSAALLALGIYLTCAGFSSATR